MAVGCVCVCVCVREGLRTMAFFCGKCDQGLTDGKRVWGGEEVDFLVYGRSLYKCTAMPLFFLIRHFSLNHPVLFHSAPFPNEWFSKHRQRTFINKPHLHPLKSNPDPLYDMTRYIR